MTERVAYKVTPAELDAAADKLGSYDLAFRSLDVTPDEVEPEDSETTLSVELPPPPIAVDLGARALALEAIMAFLNKANRVRGSKIQLENGGGRMKQQYGDEAAAVQKGAEVNRDMLLAGFRAGIATLAASEALRANGYDDSDVELAERAVQIDINKEFGVGKAGADQRARAVKYANRSATVK